MKATAANILEEGAFTSGRTISSPIPPLGGIQCSAWLTVFRLHIPIGVGVDIGIGIVSAGSILTRLLVNGIPALSQLR
jgi:hypothetical protein